MTIDLTRLAPAPWRNDEDRWGWKVFSNARNGYVGKDASVLYADPFTALVECDEWHREHVEKATVP